MQVKSKEQKNGSALQEGIHPSGNHSGLTRKDILPAVLLSLFMGVEFFPKLGAIDIMGSQWLYLVIVNFIAVILLLWVNKNDYSGPLKKISSNALMLLYTGLFLIAGISIFAAFNKIEAIVCYARFTTTFVTGFNVALLLYGRLHLFSFIAKLMTLILLINATGVIIDFSTGYGNTTLDVLVLGLKGNTGNKNILAASLAVKIPFVFYCLYTLKMTGKIISLLILTLTTLAIFILNSRAAYLSLAMILFFVIVFNLMNYLKNKNLRLLLTRLGYVFIPVIFSFFLSQAILKNALMLEGEQSTGNNIDKAGTVMERLGTIDLTARGSGNRILQWSSAWDYIKQHPFTGAGFGNWKLASIPYEKTYLDEMFVTMHVHNDFLEITAETGIIGGILLLAVFLCCAFYLLKAIFSKQEHELVLMAWFVLMALTVYIIDTVFNFPMERPVMQVSFIFILGLCINIFLPMKKDKLPDFKQRKIGLLFVSLALVLLIPAFYVTSKTYKSMVAQERFANDAASGEFKYSFEEVDAALPEIPDLDYICFPIDAFKSTYLIREKKYKEALALLDKSSNVNPALTFNDYLKAKIFIETGQPDSSFYYANKAFYNKPRARSNWYMLNRTSSALKDTAGIRKAFSEFTRYRNDAWAWNEYLSTLLELPYNKEILLAMADSALKLFPGDKLLEEKKRFIAQGPVIATPVNTEQKKTAASYYTMAMQDFNRKAYTSAAPNFIKAASLNSNDYLPIEYTGLCYFFLKDYTSAIKYFDRVLLNFNTIDGKSEFFKGTCLTQTGDKTTGCRYLQMAQAKNYPEAIKLLEIYCR